MALLYGEKENNQSVRLIAGQVLKIRLPGNPTTGYKWILQIKPDEKVFRLVKEAYQPFVKNPHILGGTGSQYWEFLSLAPGRTSLLLVYGRPWEQAPPIKTYHLEIEVR